MSKKNKHQSPRIALPPMTQTTVSASPSTGSSPPGSSVHAPQPQAPQRPTAPHSAMQQTGTPPTLEQQRAAFALKSVRAVVNEAFATEYRSYVEGLPATIVMNGLGQACATLLASANGESVRHQAYRSLHDHLQAWLCHSAGESLSNGVYPGSTSLIDAITHPQNGQSRYVHAQAESLAFLVWLKKFAQAFLLRRS